MGAVISFFKLVGTFLFSIPQNIICIFKLMIIGFFHFLLMLYPVSIVSVFMMNFHWWFANVSVKLFMFLLYGVLGGLLWIVDSAVGAITGLETSIGSQVRNAALVLSSCDNDPRAWFTTAHYHARNRYGRMFGIGLCMAPCASGYSPVAGGLMCGRKIDAVPRRCPHAYVTLAAENIERNSGASGLLSVSDRPLERAELREYRLKCDEHKLPANMARFPEAVCWQAEAGSVEFANSDVAGMCYEMMCSHDNKDSEGRVRPSFCSALVPVAGAAGGTGSLSVLVRIPIMVSVMILATVSARAQIKARQARFS